MTEQDAQRLVDFMGGSLKDLTTNPELVRDAMTKVLEMKKNDANRSASVFNANLRYMLEDPSGETRGGYAPFEMYTTIADVLKDV